MAVYTEVSDDQLDVIDGRRVELAGRIQEAYGLTKEDAEKQIKAFEESHRT